MTPRLLVPAGVLWACGASLVVPALAQPAPRPPATAAAQKSLAPGRARSWDLEASVLAFGPSGLGASSATMTTNSTTPAAPTTYFDSSARLQVAPGVGLRLGYAVTRAVVIEGGMAYSRAGVRLTVAGDIDGAAGFTSTGERLSEYSFDAGVRGYLTRLEFRRGRGRPFVTGTIGYVRQLHEGRADVDTAVSFGGGGGFTYQLVTRTSRSVRGPALRGVSLRADVRWMVTDRGYSFNGRARSGAVAGAGLLLNF